MIIIDESEFPLFSLPKPYRLSICPRACGGVVPVVTVIGKKNEDGQGPSALLNVEKAERKRGGLLWQCKANGSARRFSVVIATVRRESAVGRGDGRKRLSVLYPWELSDFHYGCARCGYWSPRLACFCAG